MSFLPHILKIIVIFLIFHETFHEIFQAKKFTKFYNAGCARLMWYEVLVEKIKAGQAPYCRPKTDIDDGELHPGILTLMKQCWAENPSERPPFDDIAKTLRNINKGKSVMTSLFSIVQRCFSVFWILRTRPPCCINQSYSINCVFIASYRISLKCYSCQGLPAIVSCSTLVSFENLIYCKKSTHSMATLTCYGIKWRRS